MKLLVRNDVTSSFFGLTIAEWNSQPTTPWKVPISSLIVDSTGRAALKCNEHDGGQNINVECRKKRKKKSVTDVTSSWAFIAALQVPFTCLLSSFFSFFFSSVLKMCAGHGPIVLCHRVTPCHAESFFFFVFLPNHELN